MFQSFREKIAREEQLLDLGQSLSPIIEVFGGVFEIYFCHQVPKKKLKSTCCCSTSKYCGLKERVEEY